MKTRSPHKGNSFSKVTILIQSNDKFCNIFYLFGTKKQKSGNFLKIATASFSSKTLYQPLGQRHIV